MIKQQSVGNHVASDPISEPISDRRDLLSLPRDADAMREKQKKAEEKKAAEQAGSSQK